MLLVGKHKKTGLFEKNLTLVVVGFHSGTQMGHTKTRKMGLFLCPLGPISYWKTKWGSLTHFLRPIRTGFALMRKICCLQLTQMWAEAGLSPALALPRYWSSKIKKAPKTSAQELSPAFKPVSVAQTVWKCERKKEKVSNWKWEEILSCNAFECRPVIINVWRLML